MFYHLKEPYLNFNCSAIMLTMSTSTLEFHRHFFVPKLFWKKICKKKHALWSWGRFQWRSQTARRALSRTPPLLKRFSSGGGSHPGNILHGREHRDEHNGDIIIRVFSSFSHPAFLPSRIQLLQSIGLFWQGIGRRNAGSSTSLLLQRLRIFPQSGKICRKTVL